MKCSEFLQELTNYLDGVLDERTKSELEDHLAWCHNHQHKKTGPRSV